MLSLKWKIFRAANIIHILFVALVFIYFFVEDIVYSTYPIYGDMLILLFLISPLILNCAHNLSLLSIFSNGNMLPKRKKVFFWIYSSLFTIFMVILGCLLISELISFLSLPSSDETPGVPADLLFKRSLIIGIFVSGVYIVVLQYLLFHLLGKYLKSKDDAIIEELGTPEIF